ncbi:MAG: helix-turn-helix domain-containing protein [Alistipes sp.]|nr:helix-turn-helix domain-containing protein [Alistipes sp.]
MENEEKEELTLKNVPKAVNYLINEIAEMRALLESVEKQMGLGVHKHRPIGIEDACRILDLTKNAINKMIRSKDIPHYDKGQKIYFFEDELIQWVEQSRVEKEQIAFPIRRRKY